MTTPSTTPIDALLVVSFGGPEGPDDVVPFLENVTWGRAIGPERLAEVGAHYALFDGVSPINGQCRDLVAALESALAARGDDLPVYWGNRNWHPLLQDTVAQMATDGVERAVAFVTSAYSSFSSCRQYLDDITRARAAVGDRAPVIEKLRTFHDHPGFVDPFVDAVRAAFASLPEDRRDAAELVFTAHSIPGAMAAGCDYEEQLAVTAELVAGAVGRSGRWELVFQSRSGPPHVPWLDPDIGDHLETRARAGAAAMVMAPIGFVSDHMEVVYDLDTEARAIADALGLPVARAATPGTDPRFISMVLDLVDERRAGAVPVALGPAGPRQMPCPPGCCPPAS